MNPRARFSLFACLSLTLVIPSALAFRPPSRPELPNLDQRAATERAPVAAEKDAAVKALAAQVPELGVDFDEHLGTPKWIRSAEGFLSGPGASGKAISASTAAAFSADDPDRATKAFLQEHTGLFGFGPEALASARSKREFVTPHSGLRTVIWEQEVDGIPVFEALLIAHTTEAQELVSLSSQFIPAAAKAADLGTPNRQSLVSAPLIAATKAVALAMNNLGEELDESAVTATAAPSAGAEQRQLLQAPPLAGDADAKLTWLPMSLESLRLCWDVILTSRVRGEMYRLLVDAESGEVLVRHCLTDYLTAASYRVYTSDSPSPFSPGYSTPQTTQPPLVARDLVTISALDTNASPNGWMDDAANETYGNNVDAHTDRNADNLADLPRPHGNPSRVFDFTLDLGQDPIWYTNAAVVQLFYLNNFMHDKLYQLGFTEAAGNFQSNNFGRGGLGNDAVQADAQDGSGTDNANFSTPPDGSPGRMQMYVFTGPTPDRDGDLDAEVVLHEYTHGLSNRRVGGGVGISALQSGGMGEGWSDFYGLSLLSAAGDDINGVYASGGYASYLIGSGYQQNYYFGIRRYPYCTDMTKNPLTFKDIDPAQADNCSSGAPYNTGFFGTCSTVSASEVHNVGEVWCMTLWEARANLITKHGWAVGNQLMLQLVTDGMNLSPANPTFLQARDAILQADQVDTGGANRAALWMAFAKRGLGVSATSPASSTTTGVKEAFDVPDNLQVTPAVLSASGPVGGPFTPNPAYFAVTNVGTNSLTWSLASSAGWITVSPTSGTLAGGAGTTVSVTLGATVTNFPLGSTTTTIWFTNQGTAVVQARTFSLNAVGRSLFENFEPGIHAPLWSAFGGVVGSTVIATNYGGSVSGVNSLWFTDAGTRFAATIPVDTSAGGNISFYLRLGNSSYPWEYVDIPGEGIVLEYSTNGGASWTLMGTYDTATYYAWTQVTTNLPAGSLSTATQFRWRQLSHSGSTYDNWALDDISIDAGPTAPYILVQPLSQTARLGSNVVFTVSAQGSPTLRYQWKKDGTNLANNARITGVTNATLSISPVLESDSGLYSVVVTNQYGSITSSNATFLVTPLDHFTWSVVPSPQAVGVPFGVTITARDALNGLVTNFNGTVNLSGSGAGSGAIYRAQFENGLEGFTINNSFGLGNGLWHLSTGRGAQAGHSASNSVYFGTGEGPNGGGNYNTGTATEGVMDSPLIDLASISGPLNLSFSCVIQSEPGTAWDHATLEVSTNNGVSYIVLASNNSGGQLFGTDSLGLWILVTNDFSAFAGRQVRLRLHFNTLDAGANTYEGWYVDDISINGQFGAAPVSPSVSGNFTNGIWSGSLTVQATASSLVLRADDGAGHTGTSNPFDVQFQNDVSITGIDSPDPVSVGANLTYTFTVANVGPSAATGVTMTNILPPSVSYVSASSSQGSCSQSAGIVTCNLGTLSGGANATVTVVVVPNAAGIITNSATVSRAEADAFLGNNSTTVSTVAQVPAISILDYTLIEGNAGTTNAVFDVKLNLPGASSVAVNFTTADGTAVAGSDYIATNGTLFFTPGETNKKIFVAVKGDIASESSETFYVNLSAPINATLADAQAVGTILNDDIPSATYLRSVAGAPWGSTANETAMNRVFGTGNWQDLRYETLNVANLFIPATTFIYMEGSDMDAVELEAFLTTNIVVIQNWVSNGGSLFLNAAPNEDNGMSFGFGVTLLYSDSTSTGVVAVASHPILTGPFTPVGTSWTGGSFGHATVSGAGLTALITNSINGHIVLGEMAYGAGHVLFGGMTTDNFHSPQPQASNLRANIIAYLNALSGYHFEWSPIASPQQVAVPFPVTITTRDLTNGMVTNFSGPVALSALVVNSNSIAITPSQSDVFTNGTWSGAITLLQPGQNVVLRADDGSGHSGTSNPFEVGVQNDVAISAVESPNPISLGGNATYTLTITNTGPLSATGVSVTNLLGTGAAFVSATVSQGTFSQNGNQVLCDLGTINGGASATVVIVASAVQGGNITNLATVGRAEADPYLGNNSASTITPVVSPAVTINDVTVREGNSGTTNALFTVSVTPPPALPIAVSYYTTNGTAVSPTDYLATNGIVSFAAGETNKTISVAVNGDTLYEANETFAVYILSLSNAITARVLGSATIQNDDSPPSVSIGDVTMAEGNIGTNFAIFPVTLSAPAGVSVTVSYATANGSATNGLDYVLKNGTLSFLSGSVSNYVSVPVLGDTAVEPDEDFYVDLINPSNATLAKREGVAVLLNDDGLAGQVDHFVWSNPGAVQYVNEPFTETITAMDAFENPATSFNGSASLSGLTISGTATNTILPVTNYYSASYAGYTCGYSFTPTNEITVTHVRTYSGNKVSIWTDTGSLLVSQAVSGTAGVWTETPLTTPLKLTAGTRYRVAVYSSSSSVYYSSTTTNVFPAGTIDQGYYYYGDYFPTTSTTIKWFFVDLRYTRAVTAPTPISPVNTGPFVNGVWVGNITVPSASAGLALKADDGNGHTGVSSPPIPVQIHNDVSVTMSDSPHPVCVGGQIMYSLLVSNTGPTVATGLIVTNWLPAAASYVLAISSQGTCSNSGGLVMCSLGSLNSADSAEIIILATVTQSLSTITNKATVYRSGVDTYASNNTAIVTTPVVLQPSVSINDVSVREGNSGTTNATFTVSVSPPPGSTVTVNFATANGTATAPSDYASTNGILSFSPGQSSKTVSVSVNGNAVYASSKTFYVNLSGVVNATLSRSQGIGTIVNDDPLPTISIADASFFEGNVGTPNATFVVTLSAPSSLTTTVNYVTVAGTALSTSDFVYKSGSLVLPPLTTSTNITVGIVGDLVAESDEIFYVDLSAPGNAALGKREAMATILNDDGLPGQVDHFTWYPLPAAQYVGQSFPVTILAFDAFNNPALSFTNGVNLTATNGGVAVALTPGSSAPFNNAFWTGNLAVNFAATNLILRADDGNGHIGLSGPITIVPQPIICCAPAANGWMSLNWDGPCTLQWATNVVGPYFELPQATSPWSINTTSGPAYYFRLKAPPASTLVP